MGVEAEEDAVAFAAQVDAGAQVDREGVDALVGDGTAQEDLDALGADGDLEAGETGRDAGPGAGRVNYVAAREGLRGRSTRQPSASGSRAVTVWLKR